jgi:hypothetical protein
MKYNDTHIVSGLCLGPALQKQADTVTVAILSGVHKRRKSVLIWQRKWKAPPHPQCKEKMIFKRKDEEERFYKYIQ